MTLELEGVAHGLLRFSPHARSPHVVAFLSYFILFIIETVHFLEEHMTTHDKRPLPWAVPDSTRACKESKGRRGEQGRRRGQGRRGEQERRRGQGRRESSDRTAKRAGTARRAGTGQRLGQTRREQGRRRGQEQQGGQGHGRGQG